MSDAPLFQVVRGDPDDTELAALTAVLTAFAARSSSPPLPTRALWCHADAVFEWRPYPLSETR